MYQPTNNTTSSPAAAAAFVQIYTIIDGEPLPLKQNNAEDTDFWRIFTMNDSMYSQIFSRDLWLLSVKLKDVQKMIDMKGQTLNGVLQLLRRLKIFDSNNLPNPRFYRWKYFHKIMDYRINPFTGEEETFEDVYVSFYGMRLIRDLLGAASNQTNHKEVLDELNRLDFGPPQEEYFYLIQQNPFELLN